MTPEQLAAIAARNAARTPGKWTQHLVDDTTVVCRGQDICCTFPGGGLDDDVDFNTDTEQRELDAAFIAHASEDIPSLLAEVARLTAVIEHDRSKVVDVLAEANAVLKNYGWLAEGRGSYAFDDDRWKDEFKVCMDSLAKVLDPMRGIASDLSDSPIKWADIVAARSMTDALTEAEKRGYDAAKEQAAGIIDNLVSHLNLEQFLLVLRDKEKAAEISQAVIAILESEATAIRAMVRP